MPATEQTWRSQKLLHTIFAVSGVILLASTIWMLAADHFRPWKPYQRKYVGMEERLASWRENQLSSEAYNQRLRDLASELEQAERAPIDDALVEEFKTEVAADVQRRRRWELAAAKETSVDELPLDDIPAGEVAANTAIDELNEGLKLAIDAAAQDPGDAELEERIGARRRLLIAFCEQTIADARFRESTLLADRKVAGGELDAAKGNLGLAVRDNRPLEQQELLQREVDAIAENFNSLFRRHQEASDHRKKLQEILSRMQAEETRIQSQIAAEQTDLSAVEASLADLRSSYFSSQFPFFGKKLLELPILDAFNSPRQIDNLWSDDLTIDYNFRRVRRFDRCTTCHQGISKTAPGTASDPGYRIAREVQLIVQGGVVDEAASDEESVATDDAAHTGASANSTLLDTYGIKFAGAGLLNEEDVTVMFVRPESPAAKARLAPTPEETAPKSGKEIRERLLFPVSSQEMAAESEKATPSGLLVGDVIVRVGDDMVTNRSQAERFLLDRVGEAVTITVSRGAPHPYASHPRLDLFVGPNSPHNITKFACTICHEGQGSATAFQWASHTPNEPHEGAAWRREYGWFDNVHWIFPMYPKRFSESSCLKCHHEVTDLEASERFPDPPAPKLMHGYNLIRKYGCFGCHEINGYDGPSRRIGPDMRLEPNYFAHALNLLELLPSVAEELDPQIAAIVEELAPSGKALDDLLRRKAELDAQKAAASAAVGAEAGEEAEPATESAPESEADGAEPAADPLDTELAEVNAAIAAAEAEMAPRRAELAVLDVRRQKVRDVQRLAELIVLDQSDGGARAELRNILMKDQPPAPVEGEEPKDPEQLSGPGAEFLGVFDQRFYAFIDSFKDVETPGQLRKVGPTLRHTAQKLDEAFLYDWIANPKSFRPSTRMPRFFGLHNHLHGDDLKRSQQFEPMEILGMSAYLTHSSQDFEFLEPPSAPEGEEAAQASIERGKRLFQTRGCLACHDHPDFADVKPYRPSDEIVQGPDLSRLGDKFSPERNPNGAKWLYSWIKDPSRYNPRTLMPNLFLEPYTEVDGAEVDPVADMVAYLMSSGENGSAAEEGDGEAEGEAAEGEVAEDEVVEEGDTSNPEQDHPGQDHPGDGHWTPAAGTLVEMNPSHEAALDQLVFDNLKEAFSTSAASNYAKRGIPAELADELKGAEVELLVDFERNGELSDEEFQKKKLLYIGRRSIGKYGCYGCHDIPGFEDSKPIGATLADWGRKDPSRLAFEHIANYIDNGHGSGHGASTHDDSAHGDSHGADSGSAGSVATETPSELPEFYHEGLLSHHRSGFAFQKLREPRSYDYHTTTNKRFNELLRMPLFPFSDEEREAVITFVLGLVADPPAPSYVNSPSPRERAIVEGRQVLDKFNCQGCHALQHDAWKIAYPQNQFEGLVERAPTKAFPFLTLGISETELANSRATDWRGQIAAHLVGMPAISDDDALPLVNDDEGDPLDDESEYNPTSVEYLFQPWSPVALDGKERPVSKGPVLVPQTTVQIKRRYSQQGGNLARYLVSRLAEHEKEANPGFNKGSQIWGWLPPVLVGEGRKVQPDWLHEFLLDPTRIRPAAVMRMPKFNMSPDEATKLVNYFAAVDNADYPHEFNYLLAGDYMTQANAAYAETAQASAASAGDTMPENRLDAAMRIVADKKTYCAQCHVIGNYTPQGTVKEMAPDLAEVFRRLRPRYTRDWIANPEAILPYTGMPVNIPFDAEKPHLGGVSQQIFPGTSLDQLQGLVDLLMRFDHYALEQADLAARVEQRSQELGGAAASTAAVESGAIESGASDSGESGAGAIPVSSGTPSASDKGG